MSTKGMEAARTARAVVTLLVLDLLWVCVVMAPRYRDMVRTVQGREMRARAAPAVAAYACMAVGLCAFVLVRDRPWESVRRGVLFGALVYGVYNGTCMAIFEDWDLAVAALDVAWGAALYGASAASAFL